MRAELENAMDLLRSREPEKLERVLELLQNTVFSFSMRVCGHREDAEDTAQEVLVKAVPYLERFENAKALASWLYTVARNRCLMSRRKSKFAPAQHLSLEELMPTPAELQLPDKAAMVTQDTERLKQAILKVPPQYRLVLVLHDVEELSTQEIAGILGIKEGNVRVRLHRARLFVRQQMTGVAAKAISPPFAQSGRKGGPPTKAPSVLQKPVRSPKCKQIFSNLSNYLDGVLDDSLCKELESHMSGCKPCEAFLASLQRTVQAVHQLPGESLEPHIAAEARSRALAGVEGAPASGSD